MIEAMTNAVSLRNDLDKLNFAPGIDTGAAAASTRPADSVQNEL